MNPTVEPLFHIHESYVEKWNVIKSISKEELDEKLRCLVLAYVYYRHLSNRYENESKNFLRYKYKNLAYYYKTNSPNNTNSFENVMFNIHGYVLKPQYLNSAIGKIYSHTKRTEAITQAFKNIVFAKDKKFIKKALERCLLECPSAERKVNMMIGSLFLKVNNYCDFMESQSNINVFEEFVIKNADRLPESVKDYFVHPYFRFARDERKVV